jgi:hypothetical protein
MRPIPRFLISLGLVLAAVAAGAERLPLKGGRWLETDGPWRLDGRRVVFRTPDGALRSLPASDVDLRASPPPRADAGPVSLEPWAVPGTIPDPAPLPQRRPARPVRRRLPPECVLVNPDPELPPEIVCGGRVLESGPEDQILLDSRPSEPLWPPSSRSTKPRSDSATCCDGSAAEGGP